VSRSGARRTEREELQDAPPSASRATTKSRSEAFGIRGDVTEGSRTATTPSISVVIVAHSPHELLMRAIESILAQSIGRASLEILVVTGFSDPELEDRLGRLGIRIESRPDLAGAPMVAEVIESSHADIITFLDYDDMYAPSRLERILQAFRRDPALTFYHNGQRYIGPDGSALPRTSEETLRLPRVHAGPPVVLRGPTKARDSRRLIGRSPDFNTSSCAIRRDVALRVAPYLRRMNLGADTMLFFGALASEGSLRADTDPLTSYRVHGSNVTLGGAGEVEQRWQKMYDFTCRLAQDFRIVREFVASAGSGDCLHVVDARIWVNRLTMTFRAPSSRRRDFIALLIDVPRYLDTFPVREDRLGIAVALPFLVSPSVGRRMYRRQYAMS